MKIKNLFSFISDLFFICRPMLLIPVWGFIAFGYFRGSSTPVTLLRWNLSPKVYLLSVVFSLSVGAVYIFNQLADIEVDKKNGGLPLIASGIVSEKIAWFCAIALALFSIITPLFWGEYALVILAVISVVIGLLYSFKPFFFSGRPFLDFLTNSFGYGTVAFGAGWFLAGKDILSVEFFFNSLPYFFLMSAGSISSTLPDLDGDRAEGKKTTAVAFGVMNAHTIATICLCISAILALQTKDTVVLLCSLISFPFYILLYFKRNDIVIESTYKIGGALCMVCAGVLFPAVLAFGLLVFIVTWLYFRIRHGVSYPSLVPEKHEN